MSPGSFASRRACLLAGCLPLLLAALALTIAWRRGAGPSRATAREARASPLVSAVRSGDAARIRELAAQGADLDSPADANGWSPLLNAVHTRSRRGARALLDAGADPNGTGSRGQRPLLMAAAYGDAAMVALLLDAGADPHLGGQGWRNALEAALTGSLDIDGFTFTRCQPAVVEVLLAREPDLAAGGPMGRLGRFFAYARGCEEIERRLAAPRPAVVLAPDERP